MKKGRYMMKDERWVWYDDVQPIQVAEGVTRRVLAYDQGVMSVENTFAVGAIGSLHSHPHTQITYVVEGEFEFEIDGIKKVVKQGDAMLKKDSVIHGCVCLKAGKLLDIFTPMRDDFV